MMEDLVTHMYFRNEKGNLCKKPFQAGILVSIKSTLALYDELKKEGVKYYLTTRVNQDCLESSFSSVRAMNGGNTHPSPVEAINAIRKLCVSKNVDYVVNANVEDTDQGRSKSVFYFLPLSLVLFWVKFFGFT